MAPGDGSLRVAIRPLRAADLDRIAEIQEAAITSLGAAVYSPPELAAWARLGWQYRHQLLGDGEFFVAAWPDRLVGVGGWSPDGMETEVAWLRYLFVHPDVAGHGVGRELVATAEASARTSGKTVFRVWSSLNAAGFYRALGYRHLRRGRWPVARGIVLDNLLMAKQP